MPTRSLTVSPGDALGDAGRLRQHLEPDQGQERRGNEAPGRSKREGHDRTSTRRVALSVGWNIEADWKGGKPPSAGLERAQEDAGCREAAWLGGERTANRGHEAMRIAGGHVDGAHGTVRPAALVEQDLH